MTPQNLYKRSHFLEGHYLDLQTFISNHIQLKEAINFNPELTLEIGFGAGVVTALLRNFDYKVITCDFNKNLNPDVIADVRDLPFRDNQFDLVICCEVLEHIPYEDLPKALSEIRRVGKNAVISIPHAVLSLASIIRIVIPFYSKTLKPKIKIPYSWFTSKSERDSHKDHYWAIGRKDYSKAKILALFSEHFLVKKHFPSDITKHYFFVLESKVKGK